MKYELLALPQLEPIDQPQFVIKSQQIFFTEKKVLILLFLKPSNCKEIASPYWYQFSWCTEKCRELLSLCISPWSRRRARRGAWWWRRTRRWRWGASRTSRSRARAPRCCRPWRAPPAGRCWRCSRESPSCRSGDCRWCEPSGENLSVVRSGENLLGKLDRDKAVVMLWVWQWLWLSLFCCYQTNK